MASVERRLLKELAELRKTPATEFTLEPNEENILTWTAKLNPPAPSLYQGGTFEVKIVVPSDYPIRPPKMTFVTRICHPNIHFKSGEICLDILKTTWSPAWTLRSTCLALLVLLDNPEVDSPLNCDAGNLLRCGDDRGYRSLIKMFTKLYAIPKPT